MLHFFISLVVVSGRAAEAFVYSWLLLLGLAIITMIVGEMKK